MDNQNLVQSPYTNYDQRDYFKIVKAKIFFRKYDE